LEDPHLPRLRKDEDMSFNLRRAELIETQKMWLLRFSSLTESVGI